ncbi:MAG: hypothetical protein IPL65_11660 [Lewinellaceae bacterium]|nr:hypothetical protein [Lewinellaceae bacterium]
MITRICVILLLLVPAIASFGQSAEEIENSTVLVEDLLYKAEKAESLAQKADFLGQGLTIARSLRYDGGIIRGSMMLGRVMLDMGNTEEALQHYLEAESKAQSTGNKTALCRANEALGDLFFKEKLNGTARQYYSKVLLQEPRNYGVMEKAADASLLDMRFDSAEYFYKELIIKYKREGNYPLLVQIYQKLANAYNENGNEPKGLYYYLAIEDIIERLGTPAEKATLYNNMGKQYAALLDYKSALVYFRKAELQCQFVKCEDPEILYANLGVALHNTGKDDEAQRYLLRSRDILIGQRDKKSLASLEHLIAGVYMNTSDFYNALNHNNLAIRYAEDTKQRDVLASTYRTEADLYHELYDFEKAYEYYQKYLTLLDSIRFEERTRRQHLDQQRTMLATAEGQIRYLLTRQSIKDLELQNAQFEEERLKLLNINLVQDKDRAEELALKQREVDDAKKRELALQALRASQDLRIASQALSVEKQNNLIETLQRQEEIDRSKRLADSTSRAQQIALLTRDKKLADLQLEQQESFKRFAYGLGALGLIILGLLGIGWLLARRTGLRLAAQNREIEAQKALIEIERGKSDRLLLNILPEEIAHELRSRGHADPKFYESATVLFTDFQNFTLLTEQLTPEQLIDELDECFLAFDEVCEKHGLEKIKTIGDAYMCAGGLPVANSTHPQDAVMAALEMMRWLRERNQRRPAAVFREMRIGIHTGPVIAGVVGKNKFAYDIWGDAVNLAARMEELGEAGRINISGATYEAVKDQFVCNYRGKKEVHNKGLVDMYFIEKV